MSYSTDIVALLLDDSTLYATLGDRVYEYPDTGRKGLTRLLTPSAYDEKTGIIKPAAVVLELDDTSDGQIVGLSTSFVTPVAIMIYDSGNTDVKYDNIITAHNRIYSLLHMASLDNAAQVLYDKTTKFKREPNLKDAAFFRMMFHVYGYRTV